MPHPTGSARRAHLEPGRDEREEQREVRVGPHLLLQPRERRVEPEADDVPASELDRPELRVLERVPVDVALAQQVGELDEGEVVLGRMLADPVDEVVVRETGCALRLQNSVTRRRPRWS
jgi:hypothetical protein